MRTAPLLAMAAAALVLCGCVERTMLIRSKPSDAPVWIDEKYVGNAPVDYKFAHYGISRIRVGPVRDENGKVIFDAIEQVYDAEWPWYETFPIDFFFEVLWPSTLSDVHELPEFALPRAVAPLFDEARTRALIDRGKAFRDQALSPLPEVPSE